MVHSSLIPSDQLLEGDGVVVRCVHGDAAVYPLCKVRIELEGHSIQVVAAVSETLPTSVLQGTDARELGDLLGMKMPQGTLSPVEQQAYVTTRARGAAEASREREERSNEEQSGVNPNPVVMTTETEVWDLGNQLEEGILEGGISRRKQTRREKRRGKKNFQMAESETTSVEQQKPEKDNILGASAEELKALQEADPTLQRSEKRLLEWRMTNQAASSRRMDCCTEEESRQLVEEEKTWMGNSLFYLRSSGSRC